MTKPYIAKLHVGEFTLCWKLPLIYTEADHPGPPHGSPLWCNYKVHAHYVEKNGEIVTPVISDWTIAREERVYSSFYDAFNEGFVIVNGEILFRGAGSADYFHMTSVFYSFSVRTGTYTRGEFKKFLGEEHTISENISKQRFTYSAFQRFDQYGSFRTGWVWDAERRILDMGSIS